VIPLATETLVELVIEDPNTESLSIGRFQPIRLQNLTFEGFTDKEVRDQATRVTRGSQRVQLALPPLADFDGTATIEFRDLKRHNPATKGYDNVPGPWQFEFTPSVPPEQSASKEFQIDQRSEVMGVELSVVQVQLSSTETNVLYDVIAPEGTYYEPLSRPLLEYEGQVLKGNTSEDDIAGHSVVSFPPIPFHVEGIKVTFPQFRSQSGPSVCFIVELPEEIADHDITHVELDQSVEIDGDTLNLISLDMGSDNFKLAYESADADTRDLELAGPRPLREIMKATDDVGNTYLPDGQLLL
jgi:hypothetical protein